MAGSFWFMPVGLVVVLGVIALAYSHKLFDLALLGLVVITVIAWLMADTLLR